MELRFTIDCIPPRATGQSTTRVGRTKSGRGFIYKDKKGDKLRNELLLLLLDHAPPIPLESPLSLNIIFVYPWRKSEPKYKRALGQIPCSTKPDLDNMLKVFIDQMQTARFFLNDSGISNLSAEKYWGDHPRISVVLSELK